MVSVIVEAVGKTQFSGQWQQNLRKMYGQVHGNAGEVRRKKRDGESWR
jgi:hypothetical protein